MCPECHGRATFVVLAHAKRHASQKLIHGCRVCGARWVQWRSFDPVLERIPTYARAAFERYTEYTVTL